jgi:hypothetical protein
MRYLRLVGMLVGFASSLAAVFAAEQQGAAVDMGQLIVTLDLPDSDNQSNPHRLWVDPGYGLMMEFPIPVLDVQGRGFRVIRGGDRDAADVAAEWVLVPHTVPPEAKTIADIPPPYTVFAMPNVEPSFRILHVTLTNGRVYSFRLETPLRVGKAGGASTGGDVVALSRVRFRVPGKPAIPAAAGRQLSTDEGADAPPIHTPTVKRVETVPEATLRECTPEIELGIVDFLRLLVANSRTRAVEVASASEVFESSEKRDVYDFGSFEIRVVWALRDTTSNAIGLALFITNRTVDTLALDPLSWALRAGAKLYQPTTVKGGLEIPPQSTVPVFLVVARDRKTGRPLQLGVGTEFQPSVRIAGRSSARPFNSYSVPLP